MDCALKTELLAEYDRALKEFADAIQELLHRMGTTRRDDFHGLYNHVETTRKSSEVAELRVKQHVRSHRC